ncbi:hypothetical protein [Halorhabdus amylolytica]|uniref:hypothetical protein n=1 Tax=Halorhabdus amylolytica TaxID=2559573 RepID=UPI0010AA4C8B|nr:hypothetical protein [Halorhabdus amylolytica]
MTAGTVPLEGTTLLVGPSEVGKTHRTAQALDAWIDNHGTDGVVVLEFAPEIERDGRLLGGRLERFRTVPDGVWHGVLDAHAPRAAADSQDEARNLARDNAERAKEILDGTPEPVAVFVNDATIPFQHATGKPERLTDYCDRADCAVLNAFESDELGTDDPVSRRERAVLDRLQEWADRTIPLSER